MKNLELSKKIMSQIFQPRGKTVVKCYSDDLYDLWFSGHMHSIFLLHWVIFLIMSNFGEENSSRNLWRIVWPQAHFRKCKMYLGSLEMDNSKDTGHLFCSITEAHCLYIPWSTGYLANSSFQAFILRVSLFQRKNMLCVGKPIPSGN